MRAVAVRSEHGAVVAPHDVKLKRLTQVVPGDGWIAGKLRAAPVNGLGLQKSDLSRAYAVLGGLESGQPTKRADKLNFSAKIQ
jgi:hypothetical protein